MQRKGNIKVVLSGRGPTTLRETDYVTSGGEGAIYRSGASIVKIYHDADKMRRDGMPDKVKALTVLQHDGIVAPQGLVQDENKDAIGFYMPFVDGEPLSRVIVSDFRTRTGFADGDAIALTASMHEIVGYAHSKQALMVDANELNWLVTFGSKRKTAATVIDVDSWSIGRWPATVIMPSIRDWNAKDFDVQTDWFAWGVVAFQVFTGIHPYKGRLDGYKPGGLVQRMEDRASEFGANVRLPAAVRDFGCIPGPLLDWFEATFQQGARSAPPSPRDTTKPARAARVMRAVVTATSGLIYDKIFARVADPVVRVWANGAALLASGELVELDTGAALGRSPDVREVVRDAGGWLIAGGDVLSPRSYHIDNAGNWTDVHLNLNTRQIFRAGERLYAITDREMIELEVRMLARPTLVTGRRWTVSARATAWLDDVAVQDVLGAAFVILPHAGGVTQIRVPELDGANVIAGKATGRFAAFSALDAAAGTYRRIELTFNSTLSSFQHWTGPADSADLNMGILPRGVVATIVADGELTIFVPTQGIVNKVADREITTAMRLATWGEKIVTISDGAVWHLSVKAKP